MRAEDIFAHIAAQAGVPARGNDLSIPCRACGVGRKSLHVTLKHGRILYYCFATGCSPADIERAYGVASDAPRPVAPAVRRAERAQEQQRHEKAAALAETALRGATFAEHPYLDRKGFPAEKALVSSGVLMWERADDGSWQQALRYEGWLVVPMRHYQSGKLLSAQFIAPDGEKKFLPGGIADRAVFSLGRGAKWRVYCEGYATALSIRAAMRALSQDAEVVVCFSAQNLPKVAVRKPHAFVVADNDASGTGAHYAAQCGLWWWMPGDEGDDANDAHRKYGLDYLVEGLHPLIVAV